MFTSAKKIYGWASLKANGRFAPVWLGCIFLLELILFLPLDAILVLFCLENPSRRYLYVLIATAASLVSAAAGYLLGSLAWDLIGPYVLDHWISTRFFEQVVRHYHSYQNWAVMIGSFLPIPFKAIVLSAGVCKLVIFPFMVSVFLARLARFLLLVKAVEKWGEKMKGFIDRNFGHILLVVGAKLAIGFAFFWVLGQ